MLVQCPVPTGHLVVGVARRPFGHVQGPGGLAPLDLGIGQPALGVGQGRAGRSPPVPTDPPARRAETVTGQGDDDGLRVAQGQIDHGVKIAVNDHGVAKQAVQEAVDALPSGPDPGPDGRPHRRRRTTARAGVQGQYSGREPTFAQGGQGVSSLADVADHHSVQRRTRRCLEGRLEAIVHLDQVQQRPQDAFDAGQVLGTGP